jgi:hypothetical protein
VDNRVDNALKIQETLTKNGCIIKTRLGLHDVSETSCANDGLILLQPCGEREEIEKLVADLNGIGGVRAKLIDLN